MPWRNPDRQSAAVNSSAVSAATPARRADHGQRFAVSSACMHNAGATIQPLGRIETNAIIAGTTARRQIQPRS